MLRAILVRNREIGLSGHVNSQDLEGSSKLQLWTCTDGFQRANLANVSVVWSSKAKVLNES